jgi:hypothetical protein
MHNEDIRERRALHETGADSREPAMQTLQELIQSGRIVDVMLVFIALEIVMVLAIRRSRGGGVPALPLLINIGAGGSLMLALRVALTDGGWQTLTACLLAALVFHVLDLLARWEAPLQADDSR